METYHWVLIGLIAMIVGFISEMCGAIELTLICLLIVSAVTMRLLVFRNGLM